MLNDIFSLLSVVNLPHEGVADYLGDFLVATDDAGMMIGCIGLERHAKIGLLRSLAVHPDYQGNRIGSRLTSALLAIAEREGLTEIVLLTTTARDFFARVFGFREADRSSYESALRNSPEWNLPRCSSAVLMQLSLENKGLPGT
ncbi:MAG TPA: GNAT family N-acetyltransferase [Blastocatellia bacterium]|nr:GNAT family N-acetyltransferase [Blastocatellia bacterium]